MISGYGTGSTVCGGDFQFFFLAPRIPQGLWSPFHPNTAGICAADGGVIIKKVWLRKEWAGCPWGVVELLPLVANVPTLGVVKKSCNGQVHM